MKELQLLYVHGGGIGYGRYGVNLARYLTKAGVDVYDRIQEQADEIIPTQDLRNPHYVLEEQGERRYKRTNVACWISTPGHARGWWDGQHVGIGTMWEATKLPESFRESLHNFATVIVPSDQNVELFSRYHHNVRKVPLGIDTDVWRYRKRESPTTEFRFLIGGSGARKGTDLAVKAFRKVFTPGSWGSDDPVPTLILKSPKPEDFYGERIRRVPGRISPEDEVSLYASAHCYLQPSRGEGFGLQPLQAIAQGCPTILTDAHGHADFAYLGYGLQTSMKPAAYFIYGDAGEWWEPNFDDLCDHMRYVYDNYDRATAFADEASGIAQRTWGWEHTARRFIDAFDGQLELPYAGDGEWITPDSKLFKVRVTREWKADIAGKVYIFQPGVDYYEPADTKRIMYEADLLDPSCLDEVDTGLTEKQVATLGAWRAEHSFCPTCGQQLGSGVRKADLIFRELEEASTPMPRPRVTLCSMFRDAVLYLERYFEQVKALEEFMDVRLVLAEGDSTDHTYQALAKLDLELIKVDHGGDRYGSVDHPTRWQNIASVVRPLLEAVGDPGDAFIWVESDLVWEAGALAKLVLDLEEVPAVAPMLMANNHTRFYDVWGYRKDGKRFEAGAPYFPDMPATGLVPIDSCGSCFVLRPDVFKRVVAEWDGIWPFHTSDGLWLDTEAEVVHP